jgi:protein-L-isoaspartate(D-aspartate) O-methyltransferase
VIPVGANDVQIMTTLTKLADNTIEKKEFGAFRFVPMLEDKSKEK